ncbi:uncharacterized protein LALA0_S07e03422g [Lachancea lanzarotensis]|uniref:LALA0S07e03422g1_1 n=1 Tax=Lachancea lanzarotensis TaxID=1245769 RepID=A0A0C7MT66_9SACH|nr:uncharacterized protein LALA0_S07e03422g [Lachancea lanzarotensis]CEP63146.1 LALA0S07e03422g1_1 [Lachancea lanzarotensis]
MRKTKLWRSGFLGSLVLLLTIYLVSLGSGDSNVGTQRKGFVAVVKKVTGSNIIKLANSIQLRDFFRAWHLDELDALKAGPLNDDLTWTEVSSTQEIVRGPGRNSEYFVQYNFDARFTIAVYYRYLSDSRGVKEVPFSWYDWKDLGPKLNKLMSPEGPQCEDIFVEKGFKQADNYEQRFPEILVEKGSISNFCVPNLVSPVQFQVRKIQVRCEAEALALQAASFLFHNELKPANLIFLNSEGQSTTVGTKLTKDRHSLANSSLLEPFFPSDSLPKQDLDEPFAEEELNVIFDTHAEYDNLFLSNGSLIKNHPRYLTEVHPKTFEFSLEEEVETLEAGKNLSPSEESFLHNLIYVQNHLEEGTPEFKYFHEASDIAGDGNKFENSMDSRFFSGLIDDHWQRQRIFNALIRNWLRFTESENLTSWIAHESLHGYLFTGSRFPWSLSNSFQMPLHDLNLLAKYFNQSLVVAPATESIGRYFIDIQPFIASRDNRDGVNNVDARFIDIDSGFFIDIFGLGYSSHPSENMRLQNHFGLDHGGRRDIESFNRENGILSERNGKNFLLSEIFPLRLSMYHGLPARVPFSTLTILKDEYHISSSFYGVKVQLNKHRLVPSLGVWIENSKLNNWLGPRRAAKAHELTIKEVQSILSVLLSEGSYEDLIYWMRSQEQFSFRLEELAIESSKLTREEKLASLESLQHVQVELASAFSDPFLSERRSNKWKQLVELMDHAVGTDMFSKRVLKDIMSELSDALVSWKRKQREQHMEMSRLALDDSAHTQSTRLFFMREDARERSLREPLIFKEDFTA